jgi:hypothetical protein
VIKKEKKLQQEKIAALMDNLSVLKKAEAESYQHNTANILGECSYWLHRLHMENEALTEENEAMARHWKFHFSGLAMEGFISRSVHSDGLDIGKITEAAFRVADLMVKYGKEESKTKGTEDGLGTASSENSNPEQS